MAAPTPHCLLLSLPVELISAIASYISSQADLCSLALTSKQLNDVTTPLLYRQISLGVARDSERNDEQVVSLVVLLLEQPRLAVYVQHLNINPLSGMGISVEHSNVVQDAIDHLVPEQNNKRIFSPQHVIGQRQEEALFTLLLHALPNLKGLKIGAKGFDGEYHSWLLGQMTGPSRRILQKLENIVILGPESKRYTTASTVAQTFWPWFRMPGLKRVFLCAFFWDFYEKAGINRNISNSTYLAEATDRRDAGTAELSTVEHLHIRSGTYHLRFLCDLITSCLQLRTFHFENYVGNGNWIPPSLVSALVLHVPTLTKLTLGKNTSAAVDAVDAEPLGLRRLTSLQYLDIPIRNLLPGMHLQVKGMEAIALAIPDQLPPGLHQLSIKLDMHEDPHGYCITALTNLVERQLEMMPVLEELSIKMLSNGYVHPSVEIHEALSARAVSNGIRLRIWYHPAIDPSGSTLFEEVNWETEGREPTWSHDYGLREYVPSRESIIYWRRIQEFVE